MSRPLPPVRPAAAAAEPALPASPEHFLRPGTLRFAAPPPLALYVHLPWCLKKCPYCDFNSHGTAGLDAATQDRYVDALVADLEASLPLVWGRRVVSVFIGGGTPSLFEPAADVDRRCSTSSRSTCPQPGRSPASSHRTTPADLGWPGSTRDLFRTRKPRPPSPQRNTSTRAHGADSKPHTKPRSTPQTR